MIVLSRLSSDDCSHRRFGCSLFSLAFSHAFRLVSRHLFIIESTLNPSPVLSVSRFSLLPSSLGECTVKALVWWPPPSSVGLFIVQPRILTHFVLYLVISLQLKVHFGHYQLCLLISSVYKSWLGECAVEALVWWWMKDLFNCYSHDLLCFVSTYANSSISNTNRHHCQPGCSLSGLALSFLLYRVISSQLEVHFGLCQLCQFVGSVC